MQAFKAYPDKHVPFVVRKDTASIANSVGFDNVRELDHWQAASLGEVQITATPARHSVPQNTYILQANGYTVFFGGDTLLIPALSEVVQRFPSIDVALLPVNGLAIRPMLNKKIVMNARDAAELCTILRPRIAIPIHYAFHGSKLGDRFLLKYDGTAEEFAQVTAQRAPGTEVHILPPGQPFSINLPPRAEP
jgi:L-ascorbate metabolism protein UlaG (beta-lactamase superfamily)